MLFLTALTALATLATTPPTAPASPPVVVIHAMDYAFRAPKSVKAGVTTFRLVNDGKDLHHLSLFKLGAGKTIADFAAAMKKPGPPPTWITDVGGPNPAVPGGSAEATLDLEPGTYGFACYINSPGNPMPHMAKGMVGSIVVEPAPAGVEQAGAPRGDVNIHTDDYKFTFAGPLTAGKHMVTVTNNAAQSHEVVLIKLAPGKKIADVNEWVTRDLLKGPPPGAPAGGMAALAKGRSGTFPLELTPGEYGIICFVPDGKDGKPHSTHGMQQQFTVK